MSLAITILVALLRVEGGDHPEYCVHPFSDMMIQPDDITCGPTCVAMLLRHHGIDVDVDEVKALTKTVWFSLEGRDIGMTLPSYISSAISDYGLSPRQFSGRISDLKRQVAGSGPCITLVRSEEYGWHYVLVIGYDRESVFFINPSIGSLEGLSVREFLSAWDWSGDISGRECGPAPAFWVRSFGVEPCSFTWVED
jgi:ABC-type bacteriocin/lantibiotic exporter with double-glycine peptidase domain